LSPAAKPPDAEPVWQRIAVPLFVALGVGLRVTYYLVNQPLWGDEAFVAVNLIRRGYLELLQPLDYGQICPYLFLWAELTAVKLFGFHELSLRGFSMVCSVASVFVFRHMAGRVARGLPFVSALAIFAVAFHPIRYGAEVKPYASDLLAALVLLALTIEWWRAPARSRWLWTLAAFTPVMLLTSYPAVFVAGGIGLALAPQIAQSDRRAVKAAFAVFGVMLLASFLVLSATAIALQSKSVLPALRDYWAPSFPPTHSARALAIWLIDVHTGSMFAYPGGGKRGGSAPILVLVILASFVFWNRGRRTLAAIYLVPFALALAAAFLRRYPYGGEARIAQYVAPTICLFAGVGIARLLMLLPRGRIRSLAAASALVGLAAVGIVPVAQVVGRPYRFDVDRRDREFAQRFWPAQAREAEIACFRWDFGIVNKNSMNFPSAVYVCNQRIYSPQRWHSAGPAWDRISPARPLRCILNDDTPENDPAVVSRLAELSRRFALRQRQVVFIEPESPERRRRRRRVVVFEFVPKGGGRLTASIRESPHPTPVKRR
jgi:hypothetical protein